jgi:hypothetical protein
MLTLQVLRKQGVIIRSLKRLYYRNNYTSLHEAQFQVQNFQKPLTIKKLDYKTCIFS